MATKKETAIADAIRKRALSYPETTEDHPWGETAFKVKGKVFIFMGSGEKGPLSFSLKLPSSADFALNFPGSERTHYGLGAKGWVTLRPLEGKMPMDVIHSLIDESFRAVAPKKLVASLPPK